MMISTDERRGIDCEILVYDVRATDSPVARIPVLGSKVTAALWGSFDQSIIAGHEDGSLCHYDTQVRKGWRDISSSSPNSLFSPPPLPTPSLLPLAI